MSKQEQKKAKSLLEEGMSRKGVRAKLESLFLKTNLNVINIAITRAAKEIEEGENV